MTETFWKYALFLATIFLVSCNGYAPLLTCRDSCPKSYETRDSFCVCQDYRNVGNNFKIHPPTLGKPEFYIEWEDALGCNLNRHYYLLNFSDRRLMVDVSWRKQNSIDRDHQEYEIGPNIKDYRDGVDLGYEDSPVPNSLCFDKDFMVSGWREPQHANAMESAFSTLAEAKPRMQKKHDLTLAHLQSIQANPTVLAITPSNGLKRAKIQFHTDALPKFTVKRQEVQNCQSICDSGDNLRCPIKGFPPDQDKLRSVRDRLRAPIEKSEYSAADIYQIFGLEKSSCSRSDLQVANNTLFNTGQYCALPMLLKDSDIKPFLLSLHFPEAIRGIKIGAESMSGIAFNAGVAMPSIYFADQELHDNYGGAVTDVTASDKGVYYQTTSACIFLGIR